jgi:hypothetical protein
MRVVAARVVSCKWRGACCASGSSSIG